MAITTEPVKPEQVKRILTLTEGQFGDLKAIEIKPAKLTHTISAFSNSDGGELYVGIDEAEKDGEKIRSWRGFADPEAANNHVATFESLFPLGTDHRYTFLSCAGCPGVVLFVEIQKTQAIMIASDGKPYVRRGAQNLPIKTPEAMRRLEYGKGLTSFETEPLNIPLELVTDSVAIIEFMLDVVPTAEPEDWLKKQMLVRDGRPLVAAALMFADEPQAILAKRCGIKVYRYKTKDPAGSRESLAFDPITIEGHLYKQIASAVSLTCSKAEEIPKLGDTSLETIEYPQEALHEIVTNAVLHRDYSIADDVHIRIFDNRVEVQSPGRLPAHVTVKNILHERFARNGAVVRFLNKYPNPPNKDVGEGLNTAFSAMTKLGLKEPVITELENAVLVTIKHEPLASPEKAILEYLETHDIIQNSTAREITHVTADYTIKSIFQTMATKGMIERVPGTRTRSSAYRLPAK